MCSFPDVFYWLLSTLLDGSHHCSDVAKSRSMQGIAFGHCHKSDGMMFYCPCTKWIYTSSDYKLDEGRNTPNLFNIQYAGGIFVGLYNSSSLNSSIKPYPKGTPVSFPLQSSQLSSQPITMKGIIISVPTSTSDSQLPLSDGDAPLYTIRLVDGSVHQVSLDFMDSIYNVASGDMHKISLPSWLGHSQKVMYLHEDIYKKGVMDWDLDNSMR